MLVDQWEVASGNMIGRFAEDVRIGKECYNAK